jgi:predicted phage tail protein
MDGSRDIQGYGGGGDSSSQQGSVESPDNLQSIAYARVLDLWGEGEIQGFVHPTNVLQDLALNGTPVANADGSLNFKNVKFDSRSGSQS